MPFTQFSHSSGKGLGEMKTLVILGLRSAVAIALIMAGMAPLCFAQRTIIDRREVQRDPSVPKPYIRVTVTFTDRKGNSASRVWCYEQWPTPGGGFKEVEIPCPEPPQNQTARPPQKPEKPQGLTPEDEERIRKALNPEPQVINQTMPPSPPPNGASLPWPSVPGHPEVRNPPPVELNCPACHAKYIEFLNAWNDVASKFFDPSGSYMEPRKKAEKLWDEYLACVSVCPPNSATHIMPPQNPPPGPCLPGHCTDEPLLGPCKAGESCGGTTDPCKADPGHCAQPPSACAPGEPCQPSFHEPALSHLEIGVIDVPSDWGFQHPYDAYPDVKYQDKAAIVPSTGSQGILGLLILQQSPSAQGATPCTGGNCTFSPPGAEQDVRANVTPAKQPAFAPQPVSSPLHSAEWANMQMLVVRAGSTTASEADLRQQVMLAEDVVQQGLRSLAAPLMEKQQAADAGLLNAVKSLAAPAPVTQQIPASANALPLKLNPGSSATFVDSLGKSYCIRIRVSDNSSSLDSCSPQERESVRHELADINNFIYLNVNPPPPPIPVEQWNATVSSATGDTGIPAGPSNASKTPATPGSAPASPLRNALLDAAKKLKLQREQRQHFSEDRAKLRDNLIEAAKRLKLNSAGIVVMNYWSDSGEISGTVTTDPKSYDGVPGLRVLPVTVPLVPDSTGKPTLQGLFFDSGNGVIQPADGPIVFPSSAKLLTLVPSSNPALKVSLDLTPPPPGQTAPPQNVSVPGGITTSPVCIRNAITAVHGAGQFSGDSNKIVVSFNGEPVIPVAADRDGFFFRVPADAHEGINRLVFADEGPGGPFAASALVSVLKLTTSVDQPVLHKGQRTNGHVTLSPRNEPIIYSGQLNSLGLRPADSAGNPTPDVSQSGYWAAGFDPDLVDPGAVQKIAPDFHLPKPETAATIFLSMQNASPSIISVDGFNGAYKSYYIAPDSLPFSTTLPIKAHASGGFNIQVLVVPLVAPIRCQEIQGDLTALYH